MLFNQHVAAGVSGNILVLRTSVQILQVILVINLGVVVVHPRNFTSTKAEGMLDNDAVDKPLAMFFRNTGSSFGETDNFVN